MPQAAIQPQSSAHDKLFSSARDGFEALVERLQGRECVVMSHSELERVVEADGREILRLLFQGHLDLRGTCDASDPVIGAADAHPRTGCRKRRRALETVFGRVTVERDGYTEPGAASLFVLDGYLNLPPELYSFGLRRKVALEAAKVSFDEVVASVERSTGVTVPKRQAEQLARRAAVDFNAFYEQRAHDDIVEGDDILTITTECPSE